MSDRLEEALRALREQATGHNPRAEDTLARVLAARTESSRVWRRRARVWLPMAAVLAFSTAALARWGSIDGLRARLEAREEPAASAEAPARVATKRRQGTGGPAVPDPVAEPGLPETAETPAATVTTAAPVAPEVPPAPLVAEAADAPRALAAPRDRNDRSERTAPRKARAGVPLVATAAPATGPTALAAPAAGPVAFPAAEASSVPGAPPASASAPSSAPSTAGGDGAASAEGAAYARAHRLHFDGADPASALAAWDDYLARFPAGTFAPDARYNRAIDLLKLRRYPEARAALQPFADGVFGGYHRDDARELLRSVP